MHLFITIFGTNHILCNSNVGAIHKICDARARGSRGVFDQESHSVTRRGEGCHKWYHENPSEKLFRPRFNKTLK
jgi:hypothetical protein